MRAGTLVVYVVSAVIWSLTCGCSPFFLTKTYHDAATERAVYTPIRAFKVEEASLDHDGVLTVAFSGWNCSRKIQPGTERRDMVRIQTNPSLAAAVIVFTGMWDGSMFGELALRNGAACGE